MHKLLMFCCHSLEANWFMKWKAKASLPWIPSFDEHTGTERMRAPRQLLGSYSSVGGYNTTSPECQTLPLLPGMTCPSQAIVNLCWPQEAQLVMVHVCILCLLQHQTLQCPLTSPDRHIRQANVEPNALSS